MKFDCTFTGQTALIFHADDVMKADLVSAERDRIKKHDKPSFKAGDDRCPAWTWMTYLYDDGERLAMPSDNIMKCLMKAAAAFPKAKGAGSRKSESQVAIFIPDEFCPFLGPSGSVELSDLDPIRSRPFGEQAEAVKSLGFSLFVKRVPVERKKHVRVRAKFSDWSVACRMELDEKIIDPETFQEILAYAGNRVGLGDWRPSSPVSPGPYGRFDVKVKKAV